MRRTVSFFAGFTVLACGAEPVPTPPAVEEVAVRAALPSEGTATAMSSVAAGAPVEALGTTSVGSIAVAAGGRILELHGESPELRALYADPGDPTELGAVHRIATRSDFGAWIAADAGLFQLDTLYVTSARLQLGRVLDVLEVKNGALAGLWLATEDGLHKRTGAKLDRYEIPNLEGIPSDVAIDAQGTCALVRADDQLALLEVDGTRVVSDRPPLEAGAIRDVAAGHGVLYAASAKGVLRFDPTKTPKWTRFTLTASADSAEDVLAVALDPITGVAWARTREAVVKIDGESLERFAITALPDGAAPALAVDRLGDVWSANGEALERLSTGTMGAEVSFAEDVKPWITANCSACHRNQTQNFEDYVVFKEKAEDALRRVRSGDMPRCLGGVPCPPEQHLDASEYAVLEQWMRAGKPE